MTLPLNPLYQPLYLLLVLIALSLRAAGPISATIGYRYSYHLLPPRGRGGGRGAGRGVTDRGKPPIAAHVPEGHLKGGWGGGGGDEGHVGLGARGRGWLSFGIYDLGETSVKSHFATKKKFISLGGNS